MLLDDLIQIGLGALGLHPWEFERYTYAEFVYKYKGFEAARLEMIKANDYSIRWAAYCQIVPTLDKKYKKIPFDKIVPDPYGSNDKTEVKEPVNTRVSRHLEASRRRERQIQRQLELNKQKNAGQ